MNDPKNILDKLASKGDGMTVPEGYFEDFAATMASRLPFREELDMPAAKPTPRQTHWMRVRPYVYMAAMFAGAWCLLKTFSLMAGDPNNTNLDDYPVLSRALESEKFVNEYVVDDMSSYDLYDQLLDDDGDIDLDSAVMSLSDIEGEGVDYVLPSTGIATPENQEK